MSKKLEETVDNTFSIVVISDIHTGNINAICTDEAAKFIRHKRKRTLHKNLMKAWKYCASKVSKPEIDLLVINGDAIDGDNRKDLGTEVWTTSMNEQINDTVELITSHYKFKNVIVTTGSGYHVTRGSDHVEEQLGEKLAAYETDGTIGRYLRHQILPKSKKKVDGNTRYQGVHYLFTDYKWKFKAGNEVISLTHHISHSKVEFYRSTPLAREMVTTELDSGKYAPDERPTILIRSHTHYYCMLEFSTSVGIITPAWKFPDEFLHKGGIGGTAPTIGIVEIILQPGQERRIRKILAKGDRYPTEPLADITPLMYS